MNKCPNCGNRLSKIDVLCPRCGTVVEIVQTKNDIPLRPGNVASEGAEQNKDFSPTLIVYNEDFPSGIFAEKEGRIKSPERKEEPYTGNGQLPSDQSADPNLKIEDLGGPDKNLAAQSSDKEAPPSEEYNAEDTYSERYLEKIKKMSPLPEIVEIYDFDPEEFMREYKNNNSSYNNAEAGPLPENADTQTIKKPWLEIEETLPPFKTGSVQQTSETKQANTDVAEGYRYRRRAKAALLNADTIGVSPVIKTRRKRMPVILSILLWIIVSAAFLFCFIFFDSYVKTAYGGYGGFVYSITNGKVDLGSGTLNNK